MSGSLGMEGGRGLVTPQGRREGRSREREEREGALRETLWWRRGRRAGEPSVRWMVEEREVWWVRWRASARLG